MSWLVALSFCVVVAAFVFGHRRRARRLRPVQKAQDSAIEIIRQNTEALWVVETALRNNSDTLKKLGKE